MFAKRFFYCCGGIALLAMSFQLGASRSQGDPAITPVVRASQIEIVDKNGAVAITLGSVGDGLGILLGTIEGAHGVMMVGADGNPRVLIGHGSTSLASLYATESGASATLNSSAGQAILATDPGILLGLSIARPSAVKGSIMLSILNNGAAGLEIIDDAGRWWGASPTP